MAEEPVAKTIESGVVRPVEAIPNSEHLPTPEKVLERPEAKEALPAPTPLAPAPPVVVKTVQEIRAEQIDEILSAGLGDMYLQMPAEKQTEFRVKGEETVTKINKLLNQAKINLKKIAALVRRWLALIPGVNRFFLEQETKIKTDKIIRLHH